MPLTNGLVVMTPTSIVSTGTGNSSSINSDGSVTFASCATLSLNGVFTSSYDNYIIALRGDVGGFVALEARLRASGTDNSTANSYVRQGLYASGTSVTASRTTTTFTRLGNVDSTQKYGITTYLFGPYLAQPTAIRSVGSLDLSSAYIEDYASTHNQSTAYDGITIYPSASTFEGLVTVFGFNQ
jgi:hypothetical protein